MLPLEAKIWIFYSINENNIPYWKLNPIEIQWWYLHCKLSKKPALCSNSYRIHYMKLWKHYDYRQTLLSTCSCTYEHMWFEESRQAYLETAKKKFQAPKNLAWFIFTINNVLVQLHKLRIKRNSLFVIASSLSINYWVCFPLSPI